MMTIGDKVPDCLGIDDAGHQWQAAELLGKRWILYFYPKDNTSACTKQACAIRDGYEALQQLGLTIIGVSRDTAASHRRFRERHQLPFPLIADTERTLHEAMGVLYPKKMYGKEVIGTQRTTFVVSPVGRIEAIITGKAVSTDEHAQQIIDTIKSL